MIIKTNFIMHTSWLVAVLVSSVQGVPLLKREPLLNTTSTNTTFTNTTSDQPPVFTFTKVGVDQDTEVDSNFAQGIGGQNDKRESSPQPTTVVIKDRKVFYSVDLNVGSTGLKITALIDTGLSDLWVPTKKTDSGQFTPKSSSSYKTINSNFSISYGGGTYANGNWGTDTVKMGPMKLQNLQFAVSGNFTATQPILGIGLTRNEATPQKYPNFPLALKQQGFMKRNSYLIYMGNDATASGTVIFGGIDHAKYQDDLVQLNLVNISSSGKKLPYPIGFFVDLKSIDYADQKKNLTDGTLPALLDTGTTLLIAPKAQYTKISKQFGWHVPKLGYITTCTHYDDKTLVFQFNNKSITVPVSDILKPLTHKNGKPWKVFGKEICYVGVTSHDRPYYILGDVFLKSAYVNFDLDQKVVSIAQTKKNIGESKLELLPAFNGDSDQLTNAQAHKPTSSDRKIGTIGTISTNKTIGAHDGGIANITSSRTNITTGSSKPSSTSSMSSFRAWAAQHLF